MFAIYRDGVRVVGFTSYSLAIDAAADYARHVSGRIEVLRETTGFRLF